MRPMVLGQELDQRMMVWTPWPMGWLKLKLEMSEMVSVKLMNRNRLFLNCTLKSSLTIKPKYLTKVTCLLLNSYCTRSLLAAILGKTTITSPNKVVGADTNNRCEFNNYVSDKNQAYI